MFGAGVVIACAEYDCRKVRDITSRDAPPLLCTPAPAWAAENVPVASPSRVLPDSPRSAVSRL